MDLFPAYLTFTTIWATQQMTHWYFSYISQKTGFAFSYKLSPICMKCQNLFSERKKKLSMLSAENFTWSAKH